MPANFPQPGERYYTRYPDGCALPEYYEEIKDLYVEIVDIVCYQNGDGIFLEWTLGTPSSDYYCELLHLPLVHCPPNASPYGSVFFLSCNEKLTSARNYTTYENIPLNYDYNFYINNPDHRFAVSDDYYVQFFPVQ